MLHIERICGRRRTPPRAGISTSAWPSFWSRDGGDEAEANDYRPMYRGQRDGKRSNRLVSVHGHLQHVVWGCSELLAIARMQRSFAI